MVDATRAGNGALTMTVESEPGGMGCSRCGVVAHAHGRVEVRLIDLPWAGRPVTIGWRKRRWVCPEPSCPVVSFVEQDEQVAVPRGQAHRACASVGDSADPPRARLRERGPLSAGLWLAYHVGGYHAAVVGGRRRPGTLRGRHPPRGG